MSNGLMSEFMKYMSEYGEYLTCPMCDSDNFDLHVKPKRGFILTCHSCGHIDKESFTNYEKVFWEWVK